MMNLTKICMIVLATDSFSSSCMFKSAVVILARSRLWVYGSKLTWEMEFGC